jgi:hypothetical protein
VELTMVADQKAISAEDSKTGAAWRSRLLELALAGGLATGCYGIPPCNANPDPCCNNQDPTVCAQDKQCAAAPNATCCAELAGDSYQVEMACQALKDAG